MLEGNPWRFLALEIYKLQQEYLWPYICLQSLPKRTELELAFQFQIVLVGNKQCFAEVVLLSTIDNF